MIATFSKPRSSSAWRIAPTRPSIMSDGATMSAPAAACDTAARTSCSTVGSFAISSSIDDAAVAVVGVLAQADVGDDEHVRHLALDRADRRLHRRLRIVGRRADVVLVIGQAEQQHAAGRRRPAAAATSLTASSTDRLNTPGIDGTSRRTPSPSQTNSGSMNMSGDSRVSRTSARIASDVPQPPQPPRQLQRRWRVRVVMAISRGSSDCACASTSKCFDDRVDQRRNRVAAPA